jgi:hypothetical protein
MTPAAMREKTPFLRERGRGGDSGPRPLADFVRRHRPTWAIAAAGAILLGGVGAFETGDAAPWTLYSYWTFLMFAGGAMSAALIDRLDSIGTLKERPVHAVAALILAVNTAMTPLVYGLSGWALGGSWHLERLPHLWSQGLFIMPVFLALQLVLERRFERPAAHRAVDAGGVPTPSFMPAALRGAELFAIESEDHYLRLHTDRGSALILMPLSEAVGRLEGMDGMRTHRSWWVARSAVVGASRGNGRAQLTLKNGLLAPVSRTYAPGLRGAGWF